MDVVMYCRTLFSFVFFELYIHVIITIITFNRSIFRHDMDEIRVYTKSSRLFTISTADTSIEGAYCSESACPLQDEVPPVQV